LKHSKHRLNHPLFQGFNKPGGFVVRACVEKVLTGPFSFTGDMIPGHLPVRLLGHEFLMGLLPGFFPVIKVRREIPPGNRLPQPAVFRAGIAKIVANHLKPHRLDADKERGRKKEMTALRNASANTKVL
jgi:hypothetical protein